MESLFSYNGDIYRIDGAHEKHSSLFWAERLNEKLEPTEEYRAFYFADLIKAQADALMLSQTQTVPSAWA